MPTQAKVQEVEQLKEKLERAVSLVLADYRGLTANEMVELREKFTKQGLEYRVVKDTLARIASAEAGIEGLAEMIAGPIAVALGYEDPALPFRLSEECRKKYAPLYELRGGVFEGVLVPETEVKRFASLPSREELLAKLAMLLSSPMRALAVMLKAKIRELAVVLAEVAKKRGQEPGDRAEPSPATPESAERAVEEAADPPEPAEEASAESPDPEELQEERESQEEEEEEA